MNGQWKRYAEYRPSGVDWSERVPTDWDVRRLRFRADFNPPRSQANHLPPNSEVSFVPMESVGELGGLDLSDTRTLEDIGSGYTWFQDGDVVVAKITPCFENGKGAIAEGLTNGAAFGTTELHVVRPRSGLDARFLFYLTLSHPFRGIGASTMYGAGGQKRVPDTFIRDFRPGIPTDEAEQRAIATFLDRETARIDALIAKKEDLIRLLEEKRTALISLLVTQGLETGMRMRPTGIRWIGNVPAHWETRRLATLAERFIDYRGATPKKSDSGHPLVTASNIKNGNIIWEREEFLDDDVYGVWMTRGLPRKGDLLMTPEAPLGEVALVVDDAIALALRVILGRPRHGVSGAFLRCYFRSKAGRGELWSRATGSTALGIKASRLRDVVVTVPPDFAEQERIAKAVEEWDQWADATIAGLLPSLALLREHRQALITAAVTGQIDVRDEVAS